MSLDFSKQASFKLFKTENTIKIWISIESLLSLTFSFNLFQ